jgi:hypothetical protein
MDTTPRPSLPGVLLLLGVTGLMLFTACTEESGPIYLGQPGMAIPMELDAWVPSVKVQADRDGAPLAASEMLVDTGAPLTVLARQIYDALPPGSTTVTLHAFDLTFPDYPGVVMDLFGEQTPCADERPGGLIGGDLLRFFSLGLDYRGGQAFLLDDTVEPPPLDEQTEAALQVDVDVLGGGIALLEGVSEQISVPATRVMVVQTFVEGGQEQAMVDTGASMTVVSNDLLESLGGTDRPQLCCLSVATLYGPIKGRVSRLRSLRLGPVTVDNLPVVVVDELQLLQSISQEVGKEVRLMVGGSFLRLFAVQLDYQDQRLELSRYTNADHVSPDEYVGPGFSFCKGKQDADGNETGMVVLDVFEGTDAEKQGVLPGTIIVAVDGQSVLEMDHDQARELMLEHPVGSTVGLTFKGEPANINKAVLVEELLPDFN